MGTGQPERTEAFIRLLGQHQRRLNSYVMSMVLDWNDAEDIVQETNVLLWREFHKFELGTNFYAWACKIAFHRVLAYRKQKKRSHLNFSDELIELLAKQNVDMSDRLETRHHALWQCVDKLLPDHKRILQLRYESNASVEDISCQTQRTVSAVYRLLSRIRRTLHECVTRSFESEAAR